MQVISTSDATEYEDVLAVLAALEKDSEKKRKLGEINEEGLTLIHCAARCDGAHRGRGECTRLKCLKRLIEMGAGMPRERRVEGRDQSL